MWLSSNEIREIRLLRSWVASFLYAEAFLESRRGRSIFSCRARRAHAREVTNFSRSSREWSRQELPRTGKLDSHLSSSFSIFFSVKCMAASPRLRHRRKHTVIHKPNCNNFLFQPTESKHKHSNCSEPKHQPEPNNQWPRVWSHWIFLIPWILPQPLNQVSVVRKHSKRIVYIPNPIIYRRCCAVGTPQDHPVSQHSIRKTFRSEKEYIALCRS